jgi:hypothetical protein
LNPRRLQALPIALIVLVVCPLASAAVQITLPLEGYFHPGRYMPVHVVIDNAATESITLSADGTIPLTILNSPGSIDTVAPWLATSSRVQGASWFDTSAHALNLPLQPLTDNQRLVALAGVDPAQAAALFPDATVIPIQLNLTDPLPGPTYAWESLDALLLDDAAAARVNEGQLRALLTANTLVAIRSPRRPVGDWPWQRSGDFWLLRLHRAGPDSLVAPDAYLPTYGWVRGLPLSARRSALLGALLIAALLLAATLWKPRRPLLPVAAVALLGSTLWIIWQSRQPPLIELTGRIVVESDGLSQCDRWTWLTSPVAVDGTFAAVDLAHPIFFSAAQLTSLSTQLFVFGDSRAPEFRFHLLPSATLAFVSSTTNLQTDHPPLLPARSDLASMAQAVYANPALSVAGQWTDDSETTAIMLQETTAHPRP